MEEQKKISWDLDDLDILVTFRSGNSDLDEMAKLQKSLIGSFTSYLSLKVEITETEINQKSIDGKVLNTIKFCLSVQKPF